MRVTGVDTEDMDLPMFRCSRCKAMFSKQTAYCSFDGAVTSAVPKDSLAGELFKDYELINLLGAGASGLVYKAWSPRLRHLVAIKLLFADHQLSSQKLARFHREVSILKRIEHPNVVRILDHSEPSDDIMFTVMEYLEAESLQVLVEKSGALSPKAAAQIFYDIAKGLAVVHSQNVVHRDLKPENIVLTDNGDREIAKIIDFGIAGLHEANELFDASDASKTPTRLTTEGHILGTPIYMAPEQFSESMVGPAADLYSMGVMLYEALSGHLPFDTSAMPQIMLAHHFKHHKPLPPLGGIEDLVDRLLQKAPEDRPKDATVVAREIENRFLTPSVLQKMQAPVVQEEAGVKVLLVEDDEDDYVIAKHVLSRCQTRFVVDWARDFEEAMNKVSSRRYDLLLLDHGIGSKSGIDLLKMIREFGILIPAVFLTQRHEREIDMAAMDAGAVGYLVKGEFDSRLLERTLRYALRTIKV